MRAHSHLTNPLNYLAVSKKDSTTTPLVASGPFNDVTGYREGQKMHTTKIKTRKTIGTDSFLNLESGKKSVIMLVVNGLKTQSDVYSLSPSTSLMGGGAT